MMSEEEQQRRKDLLAAARLRWQKDEITREEYRKMVDEI